MVAVQALAEQLVKQSHPVTVLTVNHGGVGISPAERTAGAHVVYLKPFLRHRAITLSPGAIPFCLKRLRAYDVVHIYGLYNLQGPAVGLFCRRWGVPYVVEPLGMYRPIVRSLFKKRLYHWFLGKGLLDGAEYIIASSDQERQELTGEGLPQEKITVRRNGVDLSELECLPERGAFRQKLGIAKDVSLVLCLGRISHKKGLDLLLRSFAGLNSSAHLAIVGPDDGDGCAQELGSLRNTLGLEHCISITGAMYGKEKLEALRDADVFVLPSRNENFGIAVAEAMACGLPVIVTDQCGIAPLVEGKAGLVVPYDDRALSEALECLLTDRDLHQRFQAQARTVAQGLSWEEPARQMETMYRELIAKAERSGPRPSESVAS